MVVRFLSAITTGWVACARLYLEEIKKEITTTRPPELALQWRRFLEHPMAFGYDDPGPWTRTTVKTRADDPLLLLDLAVYPQKRLVVFLEHLSDQLLQLDSTTQRLLSEPMFQSLRPINNRFLYANSSLGFELHEDQQYCTRIATVPGSSERTLQK